MLPDCSNWLSVEDLRLDRASEWSLRTGRRGHPLHSDDICFCIYRGRASAPYAAGSFGLSENKKANSARPAINASLPALGLSALGVVFGDIGTSPLYTLKTVFALTGEKPDPIVTLSVLSLVIWTLILITTVKYVSFAMRFDNDGEGGI